MSDLDIMLESVLILAFRILADEEVLEKSALEFQVTTVIPCPNMIGDEVVYKRPAGPPSSTSIGPPSFEGLESRLNP